ncbi:MAG: signal peptidase II [Candidatus Eisenbacteria bacterium]|nr:signal peptidase II [Candidatus Eisenbacteria bacterium]
MRRPLVQALLIASLVLAFDQWTKRWASGMLAGHPPIRVLGSFAQLSYTRNSGVAFGLGAGTHFPYWLFSVAASVAIVVLLVRRPRQGPVRRVALSLVLGGALGNLIDRVTTGEVVDFILLSWRRWQFPVFNAADSAVTVGVVMFALAWSGTGPGATRGDPHAGASGQDDARRGAAGPVPGVGAGRPLA